MKKILSILGGLVLGASALVVTSCNSDEYLDVKQPGNSIPTEEMFISEENASNALNAIYAMMNPDNDAWGLKISLLSCCITPDAQASGADNCWNNLSYTADNKDIAEVWNHAYKAIRLANTFLANLEESSSEALPEHAKKFLRGEALALRGFFQLFLAKHFGLVPILSPGEDYTNTPGKAKAQTYEEMYDLIIQDFEEAAANLEWEPRNGEYGRCTKGMALAYFGEAVMWKAYCCNQNDLYNVAKAKFEELKNSDKFTLQPCYGTLWDYEGVWNNETIWASVVENKDWTTLAAPPYCGGDGLVSLSWEWFASFEYYNPESFDRRRDRSCCYGNISQEEMEKFKMVPYAYYDGNWGRNPFIGESLGRDTTFHVASPHNSFVPSVWSTKYWRTGRVGSENRTILYWKRYADVMLDYAECCFRTGDEARAWDILNEIRNRAFGNLEPGMDIHPFLVHLNQTRLSYGIDELDEYPGADICRSTVEIKSAKDYYMEFKGSGIKGKGFSSSDWLVAINMERIKELSCEPSLRDALVRSEFLEDYLNTMYPREYDNPDYAHCPWTERKWEFNPEKVFWPIPSAEIELNELMTE